MDDICAVETVKVDPISVEKYWLMELMVEVVILEFTFRAMVRFTVDPKRVEQLTLMPANVE